MVKLKSMLLFGAVQQHLQYTATMHTLYFALDACNHPTV